MTRDEVMEALHGMSVDASHEVLRQSDAAGLMKFAKVSSELMSAIQAVYDERDALKAEATRLTDCLRKANDQAEHFEREWYLRGHELEDAKAEAEALRKDAERYRWLRMNRLWLKANLPMIAAPEFDFAIDAAIAAQQGGAP